MRKLFFTLVSSILIILAFISCEKKSIQVTLTSYKMKVTFAPTAVKSTNNKINLMYNVEVLNFEADGYKLKDFQILNSTTGTKLCSISDTGKYLMIYKPAIGSIPEELFYYPLVGHATYRFNIGLVLDQTLVPQKMKHRLILIKDGKERTIEGA
jgi:hypothetical protein